MLQRRFGSVYQAILQNWTSKHNSACSDQLCCCECVLTSRVSSWVVMQFVLSRCHMVCYMSCKCCLRRQVWVYARSISLSLSLALSLYTRAWMRRSGARPHHACRRVRISCIHIYIYIYLFIYSAHVMFRVVYVSSLCVRACVRIVSMYTYMHPFFFQREREREREGWGEQGDGTMERDRWVDKERERKS